MLLLIRDMGLHVQVLEVIFLFSVRLLILAFMTSLCGEYTRSDVYQSFGIHVYK